MDRLVNYVFLRLSCVAFLIYFKRFKRFLKYIKWRIWCLSIVNLMVHNDINDIETIQSKEYLSSSIVRLARERRRTKQNKNRITQPSISAALLSYYLNPPGTQLILSFHFQNIPSMQLLSLKYTTSKVH